MIVLGVIVKNVAHLKQVNVRPAKRDMLRLMDYVNNVESKDAQFVNRTLKINALLVKMVKYSLRIHSVLISALMVIIQKYRLIRVKNALNVMLIVRIVLDQITVIALFVRTLIIVFLLALLIAMEM